MVSVKMGIIMHISGPRGEKKEKLERKKVRRKRKTMLFKRKLYPPNKSRENTAEKLKADSRQPLEGSSGVKVSGRRLH